MTQQQKIGRYIIQGLLGEGAMGSVYKAHDPFIKRTVAIKTVKVDKARKGPEVQEFRERFQKEAEISGHLNHPNIVSIFDVGEQDDVPYIAMEFVDGDTLDDLLGKKPRPGSADLIKILLQVADALDFAHDKGIVHRDLKPSNIMVQNGVAAKIMDFGIAKMSGSNLTQTGIFLGTPSYSSPEQIKEGHVDARSDIFSFGILAHETLTGKLPFRGQSINAILYKIANEPPETVPSLPDLPVTPAAWREVFARVLHKDPDKRYQTATAFINSLMKCVSFTAEEQSKLGHLGTQVNDTVRADVREIQQDLKRSEFERSRASGTLVQSKQPRKKGRPWISLLVLLMLAAVFGVAYLQITGQLMPLVEKGRTQIEQWTNGGEKPDSDTNQPVAGADTPAPTATETTANNGENALPVIRITSTPSGAAVTVDGNQVGETPVTYTWPEASVTSTVLRLNMAGHVPVEEFLRADADYSEPLHFELSAEGIERTVASQPTGASVIIDGRNRGRSPIRFAFEKGNTYDVRVDMSGYYARSFAYEEGASDPNKLNVRLNPVPPPGTLRIDSDMDDLTLFVDGRKQAGTKVSLSPGTYDIRLRSDRFYYEKTIANLAVQSGEVQVLDTPLLITIPKLTTVGGFAKVKINGMWVKNNGQIDTTPLIDLRIPVGTHTFEFVDSGDKIVGRRTLEVVQSEPIIVDLTE